MRKITFFIDEETAKCIEAYSYASKHSSFSETLRILIADGLLQHTEKAYVSLIRKEVRKELESFMADLDRHLAYTIEDMSEELGVSLEGNLAYAATCSRATLEALVLLFDTEEHKLLERSFERAVAGDKQ